DVAQIVGRRLDYGVVGRGHLLALDLLGLGETVVAAAGVTAQLAIDPVQPAHDAGGVTGPGDDIGRLGQHHLHQLAVRGLGRAVGFAGHLHLGQRVDVAVDL